VILLNQPSSIRRFNQTWRYLMLQPRFEGSVRMKLTLPKLGLGSPLGLPKLLSSVVGVKTLHIRVLIISLESYWNVDVENGLTWAIWTSVAQVMAKRRANSQTDNLTHDHTKSGINLTPVCVGGMWHTVGKLSRRAITCCRPHPNRRSEQKIMITQSPESPNQDIFEIPPWESRDKKPFGCGCREEA